MGPHPYFIFTIISLILISVKTRYIEIFSNHLYPHSLPSMRQLWPDQYLMRDKLPFLRALQPQEKVRIQLYYECLCPDCRQFDTLQFIPAVQKLGKYLDIQTYPYGNAHTNVLPNGTVDIECQHGPNECYGNMLHACAIDNIRNYTVALFYNSCMMDYSQENVGSDDKAADKCGLSMNINPDSIKACAKSPRGLALLKAYGDESKQAGFNAVPYILINGAPNSGDNFMRDVCAAFKSPPPECSQRIPQA